MVMRLLNPEQSALMVVDLQEKFIPIIQRSEQTVRNARILIEGAAKLNVPIVVSEHYPKGLGVTTEELKDALPDTAVILEKTAFGCLGDAGIRDYMAGLNRKQIVVCGIEAHICLSQTVHQLLDSGYEVHLVMDASSSRFKSDRKAGIQKMLQSGAIAACTEMVLFEWMENARHPLFKELQALVK